MKTQSISGRLLIRRASESWMLEHQHKSSNACLLNTNKKSNTVQIESRRLTSRIAEMP